MFGSKKETPTTRLRELSRSDFKIAKGQPDIRGWDVRDEQGRKYGTVSELIFDIKADKVRYLIINVLDTPELELEKRSVMVPIGLAELDTSDNDVLLPNVTPFQLRALPRYDRTHLGAKAERDISTVFGREGFTGGMGQQTQQPATTSSSTDDDMGDSFYNHDHFNEDNMYRRRNSRIIEHNDDNHSSRDNTYIRRETEMHVPVNQRLDTDFLPGETDEEYYRRTGRRPRY
jgi:hypothetical protein